jgi:hypothetical protein
LHASRDDGGWSCGVWIGEAYFLKDAEPDKEPSSSQLAIAPCDEVLALEDSPSKLEEGLESKASEEDVEIGESSDEKDSNLALRFEGRKASYLLVQPGCGGSSAVRGLDFVEIGSSSRVIVSTAYNNIGTDRFSL